MEKLGRQKGYEFLIASAEGLEAEAAAAASDAHTAQAALSDRDMNGPTADAQRTHH